jgi:hypothetical protein
MAQLIATIALSLAIILLQYLYNYIARLFWEKGEEDSIIPLGILTGLNIFFCVILFNLIISINK